MVGRFFARKFVMEGRNAALDALDRYGVKDAYLPLTQFTYGELEDEPYAKLTMCQYCYPPLRVEEINKINEKYAKAE